MLFSRLAAAAVLPVFAVGCGYVFWAGWQIGLLANPGDYAIFLGFGAFAAVGALLLARRPQNTVSWIMAGVGLIAGIFPALESYAAYVMTTRGVPDGLAVFGAWANNIYWYLLMGLTLVYLPLLFPNGRPVTPRWRILGIVAAISLAGIIGLNALAETLHGQSVPYTIRNPIGIPGWTSAEEQSGAWIFWGGFLVSMAAAAVSVAVRYRRSRGVERQQLKWFLSAASLGPLMIGADWISPLVSEVIFYAFLAGLPVSIAVAVLRYKLWDIDVIIRRTLQYTLLTGLLALIYFGGVVLLQGLLEPLTGSVDSPLVTVITTLGIAALFTPLKNRIQGFIDRRFYRRKYSAEKTLANFAAAARDEVDPDRLASALLGAVAEAIQPLEIEVWLRR